MEAALASAFTSIGGYTAGAAAVKAGAIMSGLGTAASVVGGVATGVSLLSGVSSGYQQQAAYNTQALGYQQQAAGYVMQAQGTKLQAEMEKARAMEEGNLRRERLLKALASQTAAAGAGGVRGGTTAALQLQSVKEYSKEQASADLMSQAELARISSEKYGALAQASGAGLSAQAARGKGKAAVTGSLLSTATKLASIG